jgi:hypothetical protein
MRNTIAFSALALAALGLATSCNREPATSTTTTTSATIVNSDDAVYHLTAARCQREMECNAIGSGKRHDDYATCEREISHDVATSQSAEDCPYGIRDDRMTACLQELKSERCVNPSDRVIMLNNCRTASLCIR